MYLFLGSSLVLAVVAVSSLHSGDSRGSIMGAVLALVGAVVCVSLALFKAGLNYVAVVYLLVYIGAVLILLMFVVLSVDTVGSVSSSSRGLLAVVGGLLLVVGIQEGVAEAVFGGAYEGVGQLSSRQGGAEIPASQLGNVEISAYNVGKYSAEIPASQPDNVEISAYNVGKYSAEIPASQPGNAEISAYNVGKYSAEIPASQPGNAEISASNVGKYSAEIPASQPGNAEISVYNVGKYSAEIPASQLGHAEIGGSAVCSEQQLGWEIFGSNALNFIIVAFLLFIAIVGAIIVSESSL